jgi:glutaredoxin-related protein
MFESVQLKVIDFFLLLAPALNKDILKANHRSMIVDIILDLRHKLKLLATLKTFPQRFIVFFILGKQDTCVRHIFITLMINRA